MRRFRLSLCSLLIVLLTACEGTTFRSTVPAYPVRVSINTKMGEFVHFQPTSLGAYIIANREGIFMDGKYILPLPATDAYGYGGVLIYVDLYGYSAYDLACPYCASHNQCHPCIVDGSNAICPVCGETYDVLSGTAAPQKGLINETLRRLNVMNADGKLTITQRQ